MIKDGSRSKNHISQETFDDFFKTFPVKRFKKKFVILNSGDLSEDIFYVKKGYSKAYAVSPEGEELLVVIFQPGDFFPLISTLEPKKSEYYIEAMTDIEVIRVPRVNFLQFLNAHPNLLTDIIIRLTARFEGALTRMEYLVFGSASQKIASMILILTERFSEIKQNNNVIKVPLTHKDLGSLVGITRETTTLILKNFSNLKLISFQSKHLIIQDLEGLKKQSLIEHKNL